MMTHYDAPAISCSVSAGGGVGWSRAPRRIDLARARVFANTLIAEREAAKLATSRYVQKRAREMAALRAARQPSAAHRTAAAPQRRNRTFIASVRSGCGLLG